MALACQFTSSPLNTHHIISRQLHCRAVQEISIMKNMEMKREGSKLIIEVDLTKDFGISTKMARSPPPLGRGELPQIPLYSHLKIILYATSENHSVKVV